MSRVDLPRPSVGAPRSSRSAAALAPSLRGGTGDLAGKLDRVSAWITAGVVALAPLPFGSVDRLAVLSWCVLLALALVLVDLRRVRPGHRLVLIPVFATAFVFLLLVAMQVAGLPPAPVNDVWEQAGELLGRPLRATVSVNVEETLRALGPPILILLSFCCAFLHAIERRNARLIMAAALYSGVLYALIGIVQLTFFPGALLWADKIAYENDLTGSFVNRNTAGTYFGCCLIVATVRLLQHYFEASDPPDPAMAGVRVSAFDQLRPRLTLDLCCVFVLLVALLLTHSRAGILFSVFSLLVTILILLRARLASRGNLVLAGIVLVFGAGLLLEILGGGVARRIFGEGLIDLGRASVYASSQSIISDYPFFGTGLGTFADVFPVYRSPEISSFGVWEQAHSVPIELAVELGLPMAGMVVALWIAGMAQLLRRSTGSRRGTPFVVAAFGCGLLGSLHSLVDFSPQIPGFAVVWLALLGCGLAQSILRERARPAGFAGYDRPTPTRAASAPTSGG